MDDFMALWRAKRLIYGDPVEHNIGYWNKRHLPNVLTLTYEDAQLDIMGTLRKMADFIGKSPSNDLLEKIKDHISFDNMRNNEAVNSAHNPTIKGDFIRKGKVGEWKKVLTVAQSEEIDRVYEQRLKENQLEFKYTLP